MAVNWAQAPDWANYWCTTATGQAWWLETEPELNLDRGGWSHFNKTFEQTGESEKADSFGYAGDWKASMTKRPQ